MLNRVLVVLGIALWTGGCAESMTLAGNGLSMVVACLLLWSTVNLGRRPVDSGEE